MAHVKPEMTQFRTLIKYVFSAYLIKLKIPEPNQIRFERKGVSKNVGRELKKGHLFDVFICFGVKFDQKGEQEDEDDEEEDSKRLNDDFGNIPEEGEITGKICQTARVSVDVQLCVVKS